MELCIVRHGIAEDIGEGDARTDDGRVLTKRGRERTRRVAEGLAVLGVRPERIATSPLRRAAQTASILAEVLCPGIEPELCEFLAPGASAAGLAAWLKENSAGCAMVVGHMPDVAAIASQLVSGDEGVDITFKKAGVCCIEFDGDPGEGAGRLAWLMQPRQILKLRRR
jgi:phosphohistidine phosphatase